MVAMGINMATTALETLKHPPIMKLPFHTVVACDSNTAQPPPCLSGMRIYEEAQQELTRIRDAHRTLAPTGCTGEFCQSGRQARINEARVGRDRPQAEIKQEAEDFLRECRSQGVISSDLELETRLLSAFSDIAQSTVQSQVTDNEGNTYDGLAGGSWMQTKSELEYGIRAAWRNSRRCIMRSEHEGLVLSDLRHETTSKGMAHAIVEGILKAINSCRITPTAFVFPARNPGSRGPMIWNQQILAFAGYRQADGSVLGDPASIDITDAMIELGWSPPLSKSRWDVLPLVTMAEGEDPYILELPDQLKETINITHPRYQKEFEQLDLQWVKVPVLSRLGFDIGGVQYTASPFLGWFMDAEVGSRDLGDAWRYNVFPAVVRALKLSDDPSVDFEDLEGYKQLAALVCRSLVWRLSNALTQTQSHAQAELNYAVFHSYSRQRITMSDSLTSSFQYQQFNDVYKSEKGFSLPADFGWLVPPQGSIIPLWHKGALPNYQPKPMICKHVQDPIKAWRREHPESSGISNHRPASPQDLIREDAQSRIHIFYCSAGASAAKMARKLRDRIQQMVVTHGRKFAVQKEKILNDLDLDGIESRDIVLVVASSTGDGEVPLNGKHFLRRQRSSRRDRISARFSCFGHGDTSYADTYNGAAKSIDQVLLDYGCQSLLGAVFPGDSSRGNPDWSSFNEWLDCINQPLIHPDEDNIANIDQMLIEKWEDAENTDVNFATLVASRRTSDNGLLHVELDIGHASHRVVDHIKIFAPNSVSQVSRALEALGLEADDKLDWHKADAVTLLREHVDLSASFKTLDWLFDLDPMEQKECERLAQLSALDVLVEVSSTKTISSDLARLCCKDMRVICPRTFSAASYLHYPNSRTESKTNKLELVLKYHPDGRFSHHFLSQAQAGATLRFRVTETHMGKILESQSIDAPLILFATGSGIGPIRAILQHRLKEEKESSQSHSADRYSNISVFVGARSEDAAFVEDIVKEPLSAGLIDICEVVESNAKKERAQDRMLLEKNREILARKLRAPSCVVFLCGNEAAASGAKEILSEILGDDIEEVLGERFIEEVFIT